MTCPTCRAPLPPGTKYCHECGSRVVPDVLREAGVAADPLREGIERALAGQYDVVRLLGRGGMGAVYLARDRALERAVAIKVLPPDVAGTSDALERFKREARTVANLTHPNIVPLYAFGEAQRAAGGGGGLGYYVMGYVRGESLAARLAREGRVPPHEARRILAELADALDYAHRQGVVHRDIKPDNILLDDASGRPMLTDFGIAKGRDVGRTLTQVGTVMGTPHYMAPEQAAGDREVDGRSDLYSLGVVGWAMLAGRVPFDGKGLHEILLQHVTQPPPPLRGHAPDAPDDLVAAVERCLAKDPAARWPDGRSLRQALGGDEGKELPRELEPLAGAGLLVALSAFASLYLLAVGLVRGWYDGGRMAVFWTLYPLFFSTGVLTESRHARQEGFAWRRILRVVFWQPKWWFVGWPARLRRPGDPTPRLPAAVRRFRASFSWGFFLSLASLFFVPFLDPLTEGPARHEPLLPDAAPLAWVSRWQAMVWVVPLLAVTAAGSLLMFGTLLGSQVWGWRRGLSMYVRSRLAGAPLASSFWARPEVQALLLPAPDPARGPAHEPRTPHELLRSVVEAADGLSGPTRAVGADAVSAARELLADIEAVERELAELGASLDPTELERLEQRIAALDAQGRPESAGPGGAQDERRQMRALLATQRELLQRVQARHDAALGRRAQLHEILRSLWSQLAELRVRSAAAGATPELTAETSERVRALLAEIRRGGTPPGALPRVPVERELV